jgi:L-histidine N-alpha-methyltransferase
MEFYILDSIKNELAELICEDEIDIIELGVGGDHKTQLIMNGFLNGNSGVNCYPVDISE